MLGVGGRPVDGLRKDIYFRKGAGLRQLLRIEGCFSVNQIQAIFVTDGDRFSQVGL